MIFAPENPADAYAWLTSGLGHAWVGLVCYAVFLPICKRHFTAPKTAATELTGFGYGILWEGAVQRFAEGLMGSAVDLAFVMLGLWVARAAWDRKGGQVAAALSFMAALSWAGVRRRK